MRFRRFNAILLGLGLFAFGPAARAEVLPSARPLLDKMEKAIEPLRTFEADFVQVRHLALTDEKVEATGRLRFLAPNYFRLDYRSPDADVLTMSGDSMMVYFQALKQAQRYRVDESEATQNMFLLFSARKGLLGKKYDVSLAPPSPEGQALRFQPLDDALDYPITEIQVHLNRKTGLPERLLFREQGGDVVLFRLATPKTNRKMTSNDFVFVPPRGTEVISR
jgi:outer membrane lipoprotein-sorting protein